MLHAVVLYRGLDGDYCFFDSNFKCSPSEELKAVMVRSGPGLVYWSQKRYGIQGVALSSCQYHSLAFMAFVVQNSKLPTKDLITQYVKYMGPLADEKAVRLTQALFDEAGIVIDFNSADRHTPLHSPRISGGTKRGRQERDPKPAKKRRVVSKYLEGLTPQQVSTLMANV